MKAGPVPGGSVCEYLEWDSRFFNRRIGRVVGGTLSPVAIASVRAWCGAHRIECLYLLADADDPATLRTAEDEGFHLVDVRVTLEKDARTVVSRPSGGAVRPWRPEDLSALRAMARTGFRQTRFHADPRFPEATADALYETWIDRSCHGYADAVLVAEAAGGVAGYVTCHLREDGSGQIGLLGVRSDCQGRGLGRTLTHAAVAWCAGHGAEAVRVVTQGRNRGALRVYQQCGFVVSSLELWYHRWFDEGAASHEAP